jgi:integrase
VPSKPGRGFTYRGVSCHWQEDRQRYAGKVTIGLRDDGSYDRKNAYGKTRPEVQKEIRSLQDKKDKKIQVAAGETPTVRAFFTAWVDEIHWTLERPLAPLTIASYRSDFKNWIFPVIGHLALDDVTVKNLDQVYLRMRKAGLSPGHLLRTHAIIRRGLGIAMARDLVHRNVGEIRENPGSTKGRKRKPLSTAQARHLLATIAGRPSAMRWMVGLALGPRQGEALGLTWACVDLDAGTIAIDWQLQRHPYEHGCLDPIACAAPHCRKERCVPSWEHGCDKAADCFAQPYRCPARYRGKHCPRHTLACPAPCPAGCTRHAARCKAPSGGGLKLVRPKTFAEDDDDEVATSIITLPPTVTKGLRAHKVKQDRIKKALGKEYEDNDLVFCQAGGKPLDPRADLRDWHAILKEADLPKSGTHVGRHTAAAVLYEAGMNATDVQNVLLHADSRTTAGYGKRKGAHLTTHTAAATEAALFSLDDERKRRKRRAV